MLGSLIRLENLHYDGVADRANRAALLDPMTGGSVVTCDRLADKDALG
jgi:hypothetical protein